MFRLMFVLWIIVFVLSTIVIIASSAMSWEEITVWDHHDWSSSSEISCIPYSKWDSQTGNSYGYMYDYRSYNWIPPTERKLERQEIRRENWWRKDYKEWLEDQGVEKGMMIGW